MAVKSLSVFFPAYNEEGNITTTVEKTVEILKKHTFPWEVIVVNDGSTDKTGQVVDQLQKKLNLGNRLRVIHQENGGYGMALRTGFKAARHEWVVYTDSDGQFDFSQIDNFLEKADSADAIWGFRIKRQDPIYRLMFAKGWAISLFLFFGIRLKDIDCGFKMIKKQVLEKIGDLRSSRGGMINAEIAIKIKGGGFKIAQVGVDHYPRVSGQPTGANLNVIIRSYLDLLRLWLELK